MAMNGQVLTQEVIDAIEAAYDNDPQSNVITESKFLQALCETLIDHIKTNAQVQALVTGSADTTTGILAPTTQVTTATSKVL